MINSIVCGFLFMCFNIIKTFLKALFFLFLATSLTRRICFSLHTNYLNSIFLQQLIDWKSCNGRTYKSCISFQGTIFLFCKEPFLSCWNYFYIWYLGVAFVIFVGIWSFHGNHILCHMKVQSLMPFQPKSCLSNYSNFFPILLLEVQIFLINLWRTIVT